jgi:hypothetical protein
MGRQVLKMSFSHFQQMIKNGLPWGETNYIIKMSNLLLV